MATPGSPAEEVSGQGARSASEAEQIRRAQLGSAAAFEQLALTYGARLYRFLVARLGNEPDAHDALQETLVAAWQGLPTLRDPSRFWPWLCGIAAHKAVDVQRARRPESPTASEPASAGDPETLGVRAALAALPESFREVLLLRHYLGLSEAESAQILGTRVGTVKSRTARARRALEDLL
jgi:RNA polymerase sigma-70 factor, ECF subfamily